MGDFRSLGLFAPAPLSRDHDYSGFCSGKQLLDSWLHDMAIYNQMSNYTRTFVVCDAQNRVKAYYALCAGMILRKEAGKKLAPQGTPNEIPIALLARLAVQQELQGKGIGKALLANALRNAASASQTVAFRAVVVDAVDEQAARFYLSVGFKPTKISPLKLLLPTQDILASMNGF
ncbi:GNAT family N-acetyltransferase [Aminobacter sp. SR38]|nr:GNAT family N-acetyltransferase [Aminobacter sp. SR38]